MKRAPSTTINPLHFEDLEPHRFEDLTRQLIYDFKDWQSIEATGRTGSDAGFDIRAWEKVPIVIRSDEEDVEIYDTHKMEGNLWMIQCKREHVIGPTKVSKIVREGIKDGSPPYGYILVAPVNFSKKSYDAFRIILIDKGVTEFYLWGKADLEDMLSLPKNDRVLFTFFGISLVTKRQSKSSERKFFINNKNKLARILSEGVQNQEIYKSVLIRNINDEEYPWKDKYTDFEKNPRWEEHVVFRYHPLGLNLHLHEYYAFIDKDKKVFDFSSVVDLINKPIETQHRAWDHTQKDYKLPAKVEEYWKHLPRINQAYFVINGLFRYEDMLVIDEKGDPNFDIPHIYVDPRQNIESLVGPRVFLRIGNRNDRDNYIDCEDYKKISCFPAQFPEIKVGKVYTDNPVPWNPEILDRKSVV